MPEQTRPKGGTAFLAGWIGLPLENVRATPTTERHARRAPSAARTIGQATANPAEKAPSQPAAIMPKTNASTPAAKLVSKNSVSGSELRDTAATIRQPALRHANEKRTARSQ